MDSTHVILKLYTKPNNYITNCNSNSISAIFQNILGQGTSTMHQIVHNANLALTFLVILCGDESGILLSTLVEKPLESNHEA